MTRKKLLNSTIIFALGLVVGMILGSFKLFTVIFATALVIALIAVLINFINKKDEAEKHDG